MRAYRHRNEYAEFATLHGWDYLARTFDYSSRFTSAPFGVGTGWHQTDVLREYTERGLASRYGKYLPDGDQHRPLVGPSWATTSGALTSGHYADDGVNHPRGDPPHSAGVWRRRALWR